MSVRSTLVAAVVAALLAAGCSSNADDDTASAATSAPTGTVDATGSAPADDTTTTSAVEATDAALFDSSVVHSIEMSYDQADYDAMIQTLADTGDKEWIEVTVTIDGVTYEHAGARLKGNSSLAGLSGGGPGGRRQATADTTESTTENTTGGDATGGPGPGGFGGFGSASADEPEGLPWLIRLDQFEEGQDHQGYVDIVIRSNGTETSFNEAVALQLLEQAGLASQDSASARFTVNGRDSVLRLMIEHPDDDAWQESNFDGDGALYKAESTGDWSYRGDDPASYDEVFDQEGGSSITDLTPLIGFLQFVNESDDATFAAELAERLDVDAFATYLAMMELVQNFDDIDGPGNNAYLWWDADTGRFTIVPWDMNLAFGALGGFGPGGGGPFPEGFEPPEGFELPEGFEPPEGMELPEGFEPPEGFELPDGFDPSQMGPGGFGRSNPLVERFHADEGFEALYQSKLEELRASLFDSGTADEILAGLRDVLTGSATDLVDADTIAEEAEALSESMSTAP